MRIRPPVPDDAPAVLAVLVARDVADLGVADYTLEDLRREWASSDGELATDAIVLEREGAIVAYGRVSRRGGIGVVAPDHEGHGLGARVLAWIEERERARGHDHHRQWVAAGDTRGVAMLRAAGYSVARSYWRMVRELGESEPAATPPRGVKLRAPDLDREVPVLHALDDAAFSSAPDYLPHTLEQFVDEHVGVHDVVAGLSRVAVEGRKLVGFLLARRWEAEQTGYVDILGVHPTAQRRGIGEALLRDAFAGFAAAGLREAQLGVASDNPRALELYERAGMRARFRIDVYERPAAMP